jgi:hypothetical protein
MLAAGCGQETISSDGEFASLALSVTGTFGISAPPGSVCDAGFTNTYAVDQATRVFSWDVCSWNDLTAPTERLTDHRTLAEPELTRVQQSIAKIRESDASTCGADAAAEVLDLVSSQRLWRLADDFYSGCPWGPLRGRTFVTGMNDLVSTVGDLVRH